MKKIRLDDYLLENGYLETKKEVLTHVMAGLIFVDNQKVTSVAFLINPTKIKKILIKDNKKKYVSRAGYKLEKAIDYWQLNLTNQTMLDVGSSTGGFTSCALLNGIANVVALDVGTNQLEYSLRVNPKVQVFEQTNFRTIPENFFKEKFDFITMDVSFISVKKLLANVALNLKDDGIFICLIKPQFEVTKEEATKAKGIIADLSLHEEIIQDIKQHLKKHQLELIEYIPSPLKGTKGNQEYLAKIKKKEPND